MASEFNLADSLWLVSSIPASNTAPVEVDYAQQGAIEPASDKTITSFNPDSATFNAYTLQATGEGNVSKTEVAKLSLRLTSVNANSERSWASGLSATV